MPEFTMQYIVSCFANQSPLFFIMGLFKSKKEESKSEQAPDAPPSYDQLQQAHNLEDTPQYSGSSEYPQEKSDNPGHENTGANPPYVNHQDTNYNVNYSQGGQGQGQGQGVYTIPPNDLYQVAPQQINIAYETTGQYTRPGYVEYLQNDPQRVASGNGPRPREAFGRQGAPLSKGNKNNESTGGGAFPGSSKTTYYNAANR